jgi:hypothetical protein
MDAAADFAAAVRLLKAPPAAYISYTERSYASTFSLSKDTTQAIVIRTRDGAFLKGNPDKIKISTDHEVAVNPVSKPPFDAACYVARDATAKQWNDRSVEAIALRDTCHKAEDTETDFQWLYVDPATHEPLAAIGLNDSEHVTVSLEERISRFDGRYMPAELKVHIEGHGIVGFLNVTAGQQYSAYTFRDTMP